MSELRLYRIRRNGCIPSYVTIIMDGNGRWACERGLPRRHDHHEDMKAVREEIEGAIKAKVDILTLFAFLTENWNRPAQEVPVLISLLVSYARKEMGDPIRQGVELHVLGDLDRIDRITHAAVDAIVEETRGGIVLCLNPMISYGGRGELIRVILLLAERVQRGVSTPIQIDETSLEEALFTRGLPSPDLRISTAGEYRISNFMLWQLAYTELYIFPMLWPNFDRAAFCSRDCRLSRARPPIRADRAPR